SRRPRPQPRTRRYRPRFIHRKTHRAAAWRPSRSREHARQRDNYPCNSAESGCEISSEFCLKADCFSAPHRAPILIVCAATDADRSRKTSMIPPFQDLMLPIVTMCAARDPESIANREFMEKLADQFHLTEADRKELLASGKQS